MNTFTNAKGYYKSWHREHALRHCGRKIKVGFFIPGELLECVKRALKMGIIDRNTFIFAVECHGPTAKKIRAFLKANFNRFFLWEGKAHTFDISAAREYLQVGPIQYVFADFCGQLTIDLHHWIRDELCANCEVDTPMAFTFCTSIRSNNLIEKYRKVTWSAEAIKRIHQLTRKATINLTYGHEIDELTTLKCLALTLPVNYVGKTRIDFAQPYSDTKMKMLLVLATIGTYCESQPFELTA